MTGLALQEVQTRVLLQDGVRRAAGVTRHILLCESQIYKYINIYKWNNTHKQIYIHKTEIHECRHNHILGPHTLC